MPYPLVIGPTESILLGVVVLLVFGARRLPDLARSLGEGIREFKRGSREPDDKEEESGRQSTTNIY